MFCPPSSAFQPSWRVWTRRVYCISVFIPIGLLAQSEVSNTPDSSHPSQFCPGTITDPCLSNMTVCNWAVVDAVRKCLLS